MTYFSFVALTPGVLVCVGILRYINGAIGGRKSQIKGPIQGQMVRNLR